MTWEDVNLVWRIKTSCRRENVYVREWEMTVELGKYEGSSRKRNMISKTLKAEEEKSL